ncbi:MAG: DUF488 family protein [Lachnospiraceae bacterium]|nr:DUF488 family protein [Lachnospiraceae bacterium]
MFEIKIKRAYEAADETDGIRILIDRLWPRGISKDKLQIVSWEKDLAPSADLRKWFDHDPEKFDEFSRKYRQELEENERSDEFLAECRKWLENQNLTFVYAAKDEEHNNALVLREWVKAQI